MKHSFMTFIFFMLSVFYSIASNATEQTLATITNDQDQETCLLIIDVGSDSREIKSFYKDTWNAGKRISREALDYKTISTGMILLKNGKYVVFKLQSQNFDKQLGGMITIDTLYNGAKGARKNYQVDLAQDKSGWALFKSGKIIKEMFIESNKVMLLGVVGIKNITMK